jgi:hypothetical protein
MEGFFGGIWQRGPGCFAAVLISWSIRSIARLARGARRRTFFVNGRLECSMCNAEIVSETLGNMADTTEFIQ